MSEDLRNNEEFYHSLEENYDGRKQFILLRSKTWIIVFTKHVHAWVFEFYCSIELACKVSPKIKWFQR